MTCLSSLADNSATLTIDTSVLINLHASTYGACILSALPNDIIVSEIVALELEHETSRANGEHKFISDLASDGKVQVSPLTDAEYEIYERLVSGKSSLDDGEAATIAIASQRAALPVIDERKGRVKSKELCGGVAPVWSLDLLRHPSVIDKLGGTVALEALFFALRDGRMRIAKDMCDQVVGLIGFERALECKSLPEYKTRSIDWQQNLSISSRYTE